MGIRTLPLNKRIYQDVLDLIHSRRLQPGDTLPTERELQERYGVSRAPVRQALGKLETEGYILRTPGRGTVVANRSAFPLVRLSGFAHYYNQLADRIISRTMAVESTAADDEVAAHFGVAPGSMVLKVHRVRMVEGEVTAYMTNYFSMPELGVPFPDHGSEYLTLQQFTRQLINREEAEVQEDLTATLVPGEVAEVMQVARGTPVLFVTRRGWDEQRRPVEISRYWARTDKTSYRTFLSTKQLEG